jgi:hypothetical protein
MTALRASFVRRRSVQNTSARAEAELLVSDPRGDISPAQMVENKLWSILSHSEMRLSDMRLAGPLRYRHRS